MHQIVHQSMKKKPRLGLGFEDGAKRTRTADPLHAMQVLYQLSYGPVETLGRRGAGRPALARRPAWRRWSLQRRLLKPGATPPPACLER